MKIKLNTSIGSADFNYAAREIVDVDDELAAKWLESGIASPVDEPNSPEQAVGGGFETPESPMVKTRKK
jgi:hypothetical protein